MDNKFTFEILYAIYTRCKTFFVLWAISQDQDILPWSLRHKGGWICDQVKLENGGDGKQNQIA